MYDIALTRSVFPAQEDTDVRETTVGALLRATAQTTPDAPALVEVGIDGRTGRRWSYGELLTDAEGLALALSTRFAPGERICVWAPNIPEWVLLEYACGLAGLTLVTANPAYQASELAYVLEQSRSVALFRTAEHRGNPMARIAAEAAAGLPAVREVVNIENHDALFRHGDRPAALPDITADDAAQIQYTSGTTGFPKGAVLSHRALTNNARYFTRRTGGDASAVWACFMPLFHTAGCGMTTLGCLQIGGTMVVMRIFDAATVLRLIGPERISAFIAVPTMLVTMLEVLEHEEADLSPMQIIISGGSMVAPELVRRVSDRFGCAYQTVYGQTECAPLITQHQHGDTFDDICNTIGQPMPQTEVSIRSVEDNTVLPLGEQGEICVRGYCTMIEYNDNPQATAATVDADGWLHTGDLGTVDARGYFRITGRVKEMIIRGGENLFPAEIENCLLEHPAVAEVAVVGLPDEKWGEIVAAFIRAEDGARLDREDLHAHCRAHIAPHKTPTVWCAVDDFPLTGSGKIQKFALRDGYAAGDYPAL